MTASADERTSQGPTELRARLDHNETEFSALVATAEQQAASGRPESAAAWTQIAATHAWLNPNGRFTSTALEGLLVRLSGEVPDRARPDRSGTTGSVLHVVTQAYQTGGSTQFLACWVDQDRQNRHQIALTRQGSVPVPAKLRDRSGGRVGLTRVDHASGLLRRAADLRRLARRCELVLVHAHPYDVVPGLAFADAADLPPVVYVDHADHVFWLGTAVAGTLLSMRHSGADLAVERRAIEPGRTVLLPRPLAPRGRSVTRAEAKRALGLDERQVLVVTAADASKYRPITGLGLLATVMPLLRSRSDLILVAAGPADEGPWRQANEQTGGRVRALGLLPDVSLLQQAADVYLDSYPFSSLTSLLEAGSFGTPVVSYAAHPTSCAVFGADTPGVDEWMLRPTTPEALRSALAQLADDPGLRATMGSGMAESIRETHTGPGWRAGRDRLEAHARSSTRPVLGADPGRETGELDALLLEVMTRTSLARGRRGAILDNLGLLPWRARAEVAAELACAGARPTARDLLPEHLRTRLAGLRAGARNHLPPLHRQPAASQPPTATGPVSRTDVGSSARPSRDHETESHHGLS